MNIKLFSVGFFILILLNSGCFLNHPRNGIYLIPKGYTGDVIIFFNQPDGVTPEVENGLYVYKIPEDGVLKVKSKGITGIVNLSYFYVNESNERQKIEYLRITGSTDMNGKPKDKFDGQINQNEYKNSIFVMNTGGLGSFNTKNGVIQFTNFIVGTPKDSEQLYDKMQKRISEFQRKFLQNN
jgi:hypothetical protein